MLLHGQGNELKSFSSELNNEQLTNKDADDNQNEQVVVSNVSADVDIALFEFSSVEEVKHLQEDKYVKEDTQMNTCHFVPLVNLQS